MLELVIPGNHKSYYDEVKEEFVEVDEDEITIQLEHSLYSIAKWEEKWHKAFLGKREKTFEEVLDYIRCMTLNDVDKNVYTRLSQDLVNKIIDYLKEPMTATVINDNNFSGKPKGVKIETYTAEVIYSWMVELNIPTEYQYWHLNKLLTLIKVINVKYQKPGKIDKRAAAKERARINAERLAKYNTKG